jgi:leader peptidase (prepilin peptidase) / N-methyltransferase
VISHLLAAAGAAAIAIGLLTRHGRRDPADLVAGIALAFGVAALMIERATGSWTAITAAITGGALGSLVVIDFREHRLPRLISQGGALAVAPFVVFGGDGVIPPWEPLAAGGLSFAVAGGLVLLSRGALGLGDLYLAPLLGLTVTGGRLEGVLPMWLIATITAGLVAGLALTTRRVDREQHLPFGPFLVVGWCLAGLIS